MTKNSIMENHIYPAIINGEYGIIDKGWVEEIFLCLPPKEEKVLRLRYGFDDGITRTQKVVGRFFNLKQGAVSRIEKKAFARIHDICDLIFSRAAAIANISRRGM